MSTFGGLGTKFKQFYNVSNSDPNPLCGGILFFFISFPSYMKNSSTLF